MIAIVLFFAAVTALFEAIILWGTFPIKAMTQRTGSLLNWRLRKHTPLKIRRIRYVAFLTHVVVFIINMWIHFGTIVGTMTAVTAALVSFAVYPSVIWLKTLHMEYRNEHQPQQSA